MQQDPTLGQKLAVALARVQHASDAKKASDERAEKVHIVGAGGTVTAAYEQLRNAAEYTEENLLLQRAIGRFYRRLFLTRDEKQIKRGGEELAIELTLAGYIPNDTIPEQLVEDINRLSTEYYAAYRKLETTRGVTRTEVEAWTLNVLAAKVESLFNDPWKDYALIQTAFDYFLTRVKEDPRFSTLGNELETTLLIALYRALLKADEAVIRLELLHRRQEPIDSPTYIESNRTIDALFASSATDSVYHYIDRRGAPFRILRRMIMTNDDIVQLLQNKETFLNAFQAQIDTEYAGVNRRINNGIIKSVIFLIITKFLIGIAIEVPYDNVVYGEIAWTPLLINLLFPPIYMILLRATLTLPSQANTVRLTNQIERILFTSGNEKQLRRRSSDRRFGLAYNIVYGLLFVVIFGGVAFWLWSSFDFAPLHLVIFFIFLSAASFLGFRLSRMIRELESVESQQNGITVLRDFLYMPFVVVGRWMSDKYAKVNIVAMALDMAIELPLKTVLRLLRQWSAFISSKKDEL